MRRKSNPFYNLFAYTGIFILSILLFTGSPVRANEELRKAKLCEINFDFASMDINKKANKILKEALISIKDKSVSKIIIEGHTDGVGNKKRNEALSKRRAQSVLDWFAQNGVDTNLMSVKGHGEYIPRGDSITEEGRINSRRAEVFVLTSDNALISKSLQERPIKTKAKMKPEEKLKKLVRTSTKILPKTAKKTRTDQEKPLRTEAKIKPIEKAEKPAQPSTKRPLKTAMKTKAVVKPADYTEKPDRMAEVKKPKKMAKVNTDQQKFPKAGNNLPSIFVSDSRYEFEPVLEGATVSHDYVIQNKGTAELIINSVKTG